MNHISGLLFFFVEMNKMIHEIIIGYLSLWMLFMNV